LLSSSKTEAHSGAGEASICICEEADAEISIGNTNCKKNLIRSYVDHLIRTLYSITGSQQAIFKQINTKSFDYCIGRQCKKFSTENNTYARRFLARQTIS
jgi:hypothetical protein